MNKTDFSRRRKQPFGGMLLFMVNFLKKSLVIEIDSFVNFLNSKSNLTSVKKFTKSAFVQKRMKINPAVFKYLSQVIIKNTYIESNTTIKLFYGFRILSVDGSKLTLPNTEELKKEFGESKNQTDTGVVQARISVLYDVLNSLVLDSEMDKLKTCERTLALRHSIQWKKNDLIIYDRGYPSYDFKYEHINAGIDYLIRVKTSHSKIVQCFVDSGEKAIVTEIFPQEKHSFIGKNYNKNSPLKVRLVRVDLPSGEVEVLMTSLLDSEKYPTKIFKELYFMRWGIETFYDELKNKLKVGCFTGYSKISILQDFFCAIFISNLQSIIVNDLQEELNIKNHNTKLNYKINSNLSYGFLKNRILELLTKEASLENIFNELQNLFIQNTIPIRPNRNNKRNVGRYRNRIKPLVLKNQKDAL
ncbi:IS4 family transposase [Flavobacterium luteum]|nr:IS4 family transposase [Flavobacterium luteum]